MKKELTLTCSESRLISLVISLDGMVETSVSNVVSSTCDIAGTEFVGGRKNGRE